jgi:hypothetical protein
VEASFVSAAAIVILPDCSLEETHFRATGCVLKLTADASRQGAKSRGGSADKAESKDHPA